MPLWRTQPVDSDPVITLESWQVFEVSDDEGLSSRHFVGYNIDGREGRTSSSIVEFDPVTMIGSTRSGRKYKLVGSSGNSGDGLYTFERWCIINKIISVKDITEEFTRS